ncbi:MAG: hypothetical protein JXR37_31630 [Kiritimatiellae bacterium]|nr:hypothetical protein [Kiritimatiellia bacterium]
MTEAVVPAPSWEEAAERILAAPGVTVLVGDVDTGKTSFLRYLCGAAVGQPAAVAAVDADVGQSSIGPPATVGLAFWAPGSAVAPVPWPAREMCFVGSVTPVGHLLPLLVGTARLVGRARELGAAHVVVDTTGLVRGDVGRILKQAKLDLIRPRHVVLIDPDADLDETVAPAAADPATRVHRMASAPERRRRAETSRSENRARLFDTYFRFSRECRLAADSLFFTMGRREALRPNLLVGLADRANRTLALARVLRAAGGELVLHTPLTAPLAEQVRGIQLSRMTLPEYAPTQVR